mmetsp:Transcript_46895/g.109790  ORF Transcript_46895/g.109790 Transcript_46895/m.109790 type:complete len:229 (-) Transcript_46895:263-949(-)
MFIVHRVEEKSQGSFSKLELLLELRVLLAEQAVLVMGGLLKRKELIDQCVLLRHLLLQRVVDGVRLLQLEPQFLTLRLQGLATLVKLRELLPKCIHFGLGCLLRFVRFLQPRLKFHLLHLLELEHVAQLTVAGLGLEEFPANQLFGSPLTFNLFLQCQKHLLSRGLAQGKLLLCELQLVDQLAAPVLQSDKFPCEILDRCQSTLQGPRAEGAAVVSSITTCSTGASSC